MARLQEIFLHIYQEDQKTIANCKKRYKIYWPVYSFTPYLSQKMIFQGSLNYSKRRANKWQAAESTKREAVVS